MSSQISRLFTKSSFSFVVAFRLSYTLNLAFIGFHKPYFPKSNLLLTLN